MKTDKFMYIIISTVQYSWFFYRRGGCRWRRKSTFYIEFSSSQRERVWNVFLEWKKNTTPGTSKRRNTIYTGNLVC